MNILRFMIGRLLETAGDTSGGGGGSDSNAGGGDQAAQNAEIEQRARDMGWSSRDQWRGNPDSWIDARTFVQRGEQVMPVLQANLRKRDVEVATLRRQVGEQSAQLQSQRETLDILTNLSTEQSRQTAKDKRRELLRQQAQARADGNTDLEIDIGEQIADVTAEINAVPQQQQGKKPGQQGQGQGQGQGQQGQGQSQGQQGNPVESPDYQAFIAQNQWFGVDRRKTNYATAVAQDLRSDRSNDGLQGKAFFDRVVEEVNKVFAPPRQSSKVEGAANNGSGNGGGNGGDPNGKSYADLPQDAKAACDRDAKRLVGEGRAFKTEADWRKYYVTMYFNS